MRSLPSALLSMLSICAVCRSAAQPASIPSAQDVRHESAAAALTANEPFTPTAVIERVGRDPAAIAEFVAQRIAVDPYEGALRSPRAVLITRSANSLDRARLLAALLEAAGHRARVIARARAAPTSPASGAERSLAPPILEDVATAAFRELLALGDALHAQGLLGDTTSAAVETRTGARVEFGAQVLDPALGWRDIGGPATVPASAAEAVPDGGSSPLQLTVEVLYGADGELAQRTVLQAELPLEQIEFAPIVLEFAIGDGSATPRLHVAGTVLSGDRFPVAATAEDRSANPFSSFGGALDAIPDTIGGEEPARAHASAGELRDVRLLLVGADRDGAFSRSFSLAPPSVRADGGEDERAALLDALHVVTVVTGTPSIEYLVHDFAMATEDASVPQARLLNHVALGYFYLRSLLPASPDREALRFIDGANVLTTSVYPTADDSFAIVMNLARKRYGLLARDATPISFAERVWNGILDRTLEDFVVTLIDARTEPVLPGREQADLDVLFGETADLAIELRPEQTARVRQRLSEGTIVAFRPLQRDSGGAAWWWEIDPDGSTEDWNVWDRHQGGGGAEFSIQTQQSLRTGRSVQRLGCSVTGKMLRMAERIGSVAATVAYVALTAYTQVGQAATVVNPLLESSTTAAETVLDLAEAGCDVWGRASREAMETLPRRFAARFRAPSNAGLRPMREQLSRKPWRRNGRTFPARGGG